MSQGKGPNLFLLGGALVVALPLFAVLVMSFGRDPRAVPEPLINQAAPAFDLVDLQGEKHALADHLGKQPVVLNFWSTWCGPCKQEHPLLLRAPRAWPNVAFYGVVYNDEADKAASYLKMEGRRPANAPFVDEHGQAYPHLVDPGSAVAIDLGVAGVPETYFIDENGKILYKHKGALSERVLVELLGPPGGP
ncbi:MAG: redoxin domain-containing protein [Deltaproteobacteria bacterium]|nr:MAG: redoxin domain-containing protein [Deltaproteobacteria bacterium]